MKVISHRPAITNFVLMRMSTLSYLLLLFLAAVAPGVCAAQPGTLSIIIEPVFNGQPIVLNEQQYVNKHGDTLTIDLLKFYITNFQLLSTEGTFTDSAAHLADAERPASCTFEIRNTKEGDYVAIQFTLGVDSTTNTNGANGGDLDPAKGMYWAWNTGYVMAKLEGRSDVCRTLHHAFEFHIGGYMPPYNAAREVQLQLPAPITIRSGGNKTIKISADVAAWFDGISLVKTNSVMIPGKEACDMANRYMRMFAVKEVR